MLWLLMACAGGPETDLDTNETDDTDVDTDQPEPSGAACPLDARTALVEILDYSGSGVGGSLNAQVYDKADPWIGAPALSDDNCRYYTFSADSCGPCDDGEVCGVSGACVPERRTVKNARVIVKAGEITRTFEAEAVTGQIYGEVDFAGPYEITLQWDSSAVVANLAEAESLDATIMAASSDFDQPGDLDVQWTARDDGFLYTTIPVNHHAAGPTFTTCLAPADLGRFTVDAAMIDPLSVITGLEFQGIDHVNATAVTRGDACVDFRVGTRLSAYVQTP